MSLSSKRHRSFFFLLLAVTAAGIIALTSFGSNSFFHAHAQQISLPQTDSSTSAPRTEEEKQEINVYRQVNKAVVNVGTRAEAIDFFGSTNREGSGSGVIIDTKNAYVITNFHVIANANQITVALADGKTYSVRLIGQDPENDIAVLQIRNPPEDLVAAVLGDSSSLEVGQRVLAIGNPFGLNRTLTIGIISSLGRTIRAETGRLIEDIIQIDAAINPGNSGGPLLDTLGRVVGLNTAIVSHTGESAGIGFAVPVNQIKKALPQLVKYGKVLRPKIGVVLADSEYGPVVLDIEPNSPAARAGVVGAKHEVRQGFFTGYVIDVTQADFILGINGKRLISRSEILDELNKAEPKQPIVLLLRRGLSRRDVREVKVVPVLG